MRETRKQQVLVVDDEPEMRRVYRYLFDKPLAREFEALIVEDAEQALAALRERAVDVVVLDWTLPGISGTALSKALRLDPRTRSLGILIVTAKSSLGEEIVALEAGADDFIAKPFDEKVLHARLRSVVRRRELTLGGRNASICPGLALDWETGKLTVEGRNVRLTPKELELLRIFLQRPNMVHGYSYLWETLWGYESDRWNHVLSVSISALRRKMGARWASQLKSYRGKGYVFET